MEKLEKPQTLQIQLKDFWQLLLRSLLFASLCLFLVQLIWTENNTPESTQIENLLFISPDIQNSPALSAALDSLKNKEGNNSYFLAPNFPQWNEETKIQAEDHWQLLTQLNEFEASAKKYVFLDQQLKNYHSERPHISDNIEIHFLIGEEQWQAEIPQNKAKNVRVQIIQEKAQQADSKYVMAALKAIQAQDNSIEIINTQLLKEANKKADFYFLLSADELSPFLQEAHQNGSHIFQYAPNLNADKKSTSTIFYPTSKVELKHTLANNTKQPILLKNAFNQAVLSAEKSTAMHYFLHTQFLPTHTNWMTQAHFPIFIQQLLNHHWTSELPKTNLAIAPEQIMPNIRPNNQANNTTPISKTQNAHYHLAALLILLFFLERAYAFFNQSNKS